MARTVKVVPYDPAWPAMYQEEAKALKLALASQMVDVHHVGSTSIPDISAKPVIDILVEVVEIGVIDDLNPGMEGLGYIPHGEFGIPGRRFFTKDRGSTRTHHAHIFQTGDDEIARHLKFRDYMRAHPKEARAYSRLKETLAEKFPNDIEAYMDGKDAFIKEIDRKATAWSRLRASK